jgi:cellulose synthase/poly-beta-1,6-N-acetylglucosamine synthase-like glycosyltransferase
LRISMIIITKNEEQSIGKLLESIQKQTLPPNEVIVIDASTDSTAEIAKEYGATVIYEPVRLRGKARNTGFLASKGDFLALSDADYVLDPNWLKFLYQRVTQSDNIGGVSAKILALNKEKLIPRLIESTSQIPRLGNAVMLYRRRAVLDAGIWNPKLHNAEDIDLAQRVIKKGYKIVYEPRARAYHHHPEKLSDFLKKQFEYGQGSMLAKRFEHTLSRREKLLMVSFPFIFIKHINKMRVHPLLPLFLTMSTYAYTLGMWKCLLNETSR